MSTNGNSRKGFASMDMATKRRIASLGGKAAHAKGTAHQFTPEEARIAGAKGGAAIAARRQSIGMAELGRKGGQSVSRDRDHMARIGRLGGEAIARDLRHMRQIGRLGGEATHAAGTGIHA